MILVLLTEKHVYIYIMWQLVEYKVPTATGIPLAPLKVLPTHCDTTCGQKPFKYMPSCDPHSQTGKNNLGMMTAHHSLNKQNKNGLDSFNSFRLPMNYIQHSKFKFVCRIKGTQYSKYVIIHRRSIFFKNGVETPIQLYKREDI